jgi:DNA repair exonuclease SbcCD ATPase subunit
MIASDLTPEHRNFLMNVLDKGLDQFSTESITPPLFPKSPETPKTKVYPSYDPIQQMPKRQSPVVGRMVPTETIQSLTIQKELQGLQEKLASLEEKLTLQSSPKFKLSSSFASKQSRNSRHTIQSVKRNNSETAASRRSSIDSQKRSFRRSRESSLKSSRSNSRLRSVEQSEREIRKIERSVKSSPLNKDISMHRQIDRVREELQIERKRQNKLKKDSAALKENLMQRENLQIKLTRLQEEYNEMVIAFERSENIRKKQKEMIKSLKEELLLTNDLPDDLKSITVKPPVCKIQRKAPIRRTKKNGKY